MDFSVGPELEQFRSDVRAFLDEQVTADIHLRMEKTGTMHDPVFARALGQRGWIAPGWPIEEGGGGLSRVEQNILRRELAACQAPTDAIGTTMLVVSTLRALGTEAQREAVIPLALRGELNIALGYSEADSGSDVAAARTRAVRDGDEWIVDGEKMFTSQAQLADYIFLIARSNTEVRKHRGLTMFLVPTSAAGFEVFEIKTLGGERTNVTNYRGVRLPDTARVGAVDGGWAVLSYALDLEHGANFGLDIERVLRATADLLRRTSEANLGIADPVVRSRLARIAVDVEVSELLSAQVAWMYANGQRPDAEGPMTKLYSSEAFTRACSAAIDLVGPESLRQGGGYSASGPGVLEHAFRHSQVTRIYAGTSEIQRSLISEKGLGLPRSRMSDQAIQ